MSFTTCAGRLTLTGAVSVLRLAGVDGCVPSVNPPQATESVSVSPTSPTRFFAVFAGAYRLVTQRSYAGLAGTVCE